MNDLTLANAETHLSLRSARRDPDERLIQLIYLDALAHYPPDQRGSFRGGRIALIARTLCTSAGLRCTMLYRMAHAARMGGRVPGRIAARFLGWVGLHWYGCSISPMARIGGGLILPHPHGIVIGPHVVIGRRAWIFQNVSVGGAPGREGQPQVGDDARLYTGAVLTGPIRVGHGVMVGANAVVSRDVPDGAVVRAPASTLDRA